MATILYSPEGEKVRVNKTSKVQGYLQAGYSVYASEEEAEQAEQDRDDKVIKDANKEHPGQCAPDSIAGEEEEMDRDEIKAILTGLDIPFAKNAKTQKLRALLDDAVSD